VIKIEVTARHIKRGVPDDDLNCPIALAIQDRWPGRYVSVCPDTIQIGKRTVDTTDEQQAFMARFDRGLPVEPFTFELDELALEREETTT